MQTNFELVALVLAKPFNSTLSPGQMDLQVVASGRKLNLHIGSCIGCPNGLTSFLTSARK